MLGLTSPFSTASAAVPDANSALKWEQGAAAAGPDAVVLPATHVPTAVQAGAMSAPAIPGGPSVGDLGAVLAALAQLQPGQALTVSPLPLVVSSASGAAADGPPASKRPRRAAARGALAVLQADQQAEGLPPGTAPLPLPMPSRLYRLSVAGQPIAPVLGLPPVVARSAAIGQPAVTGQVAAAGTWAAAPVSGTQQHRATPQIVAVQEQQQQQQQQQQPVGPEQQRAEAAQQSAERQEQLTPALQQPTAPGLGAQPAQWQAQAAAQDAAAVGAAAASNAAMAAEPGLGQVAAGEAAAVGGQHIPAGPNSTQGSGGHVTVATVGNGVVGHGNGPPGQAPATGKAAAAVPLVASTPAAAFLPPPGAAQVLLTKPAAAAGVPREGRGEVGVAPGRVSLGRSASGLDRGGSGSARLRGEEDEDEEPPGSPTASEAALLNELMQQRGSSTIVDYQPEIVMAFAQVDVHAPAAGAAPLPRPAAMLPIPAAARKGKGGGGGGGNSRVGKRKGGMPQLCPGCGAPPLSEEDKRAASMRGRRRKNDDTDPRNRKAELTRQFLADHLITARLSLRDICFYHGHCATTVSRVARNLGMELPSSRAERKASAASTAAATDSEQQLSLQLERQGTGDVSIAASDAAGASGAAGQEMQGGGGSGAGGASMGRTMSLSYGPGSELPEVALVDATAEQAQAAADEALQALEAAAPQHMGVVALPVPAAAAAQRQRGAELAAAAVAGAAQRAVEGAPMLAAAIDLATVAACLNTAVAVVGELHPADGALLLPPALAALANMAPAEMQVGGASISVAPAPAGAAAAAAAAGLHVAS